MPLTIPPELKKITPYIRRAEELDRDKTNAESRLVAYYCRQYAVHAGIQYATSPTGKNCLGEILGSLEEEKVAMSNFTRDESKFLCSKFADKIFDKADGEDRAGQATKATARTFYAAASFLEMLNQFYSDDDESEEVAEIKKKAVYAKWKATDILKAIKEGRQPAPGGYGESDDAQKDEEDEDVAPPASAPPFVETVTDPSDINEQPEPAPTVLPPPVEVDDGDEQGTEVELGPPPAYPVDSQPPAASPAPAHRPPLTFSPPPAAPPAAPPMPPPPVARPQPPPEPEKNQGSSFFGFGKKKKKANKAQLSDATELTKFALAALEDKNAELAAKRLQQALEVLGR